MDENEYVSKLEPNTEEWVRDQNMLNFRKRNDVQTLKEKEEEKAYYDKIQEERELIYSKNANEAMKEKALIIKRYQNYFNERNFGFDRLIEPKREVEYDVNALNKFKNRKKHEYKLSEQGKLKRLKNKISLSKFLKEHPKFDVNNRTSKAALNSIKRFYRERQMPYSEYDYRSKHFNQEFDYKGEYFKNLKYKWMVEKTDVKDILDAMNHIKPKYQYLYLNIPFHLLVKSYNKNTDEILYYDPEMSEEEWYKKITTYIPRPKKLDVRDELYNFNDDNYKYEATFVDDYEPTGYVEPDQNYQSDIVKNAKAFKDYINHQNP